MKRNSFRFFLLSILSCSLLISACAGPGSVPEESSKATSDVSVDASSHPSPADPDDVVPVNRKQAARNLAVGKTYTTSIQASTDYPDDGKKLTDGVIADSFNGEQWVGFANARNLQVQVDLGTVEEDLADFSIGILRNLDYGIGLPRTVQIEVSRDGETYQSIGVAYPAADLSSPIVLSVGVKLQSAISARYVRFTVPVGEAAWLFFGELQVMRYGEEEPSLNYYGDATLPEVTQPDLWPAGEPDAEKTVNLIAGKVPYVKSENPISGSLATEYYNSIQSLGKLTDGKYSAAAVFSNAEFAHFTRGSSRTLLFDLTHTSAVSGLQISFLQDVGPGIFLPDSFTVSLSEDGIGWQQVYQNRELSCGKTDLYRETFDLEHTYRARFVKIDFSITTHVFCDEIQVYGTKAIPGDALAIVPDPEQPEDPDLGYIMPEDFLGVNNVLLSYHCFPEEDGQHPENGLITVEEYLPYVGYYDAEGTLQDTFMDGYLFLPYAVYNGSSQFRKLEGWKYYLDDIYMPDRNMAALNQAVGQVASELALSDYRCTVFTSVLYPWETTQDGATNLFGDLNGDGKADSFAVLENRKAAVRWLMEEEYNRFQAGNYEHLTFGGFYWFEENITVNHPEEKELILYASEYAHELGVKFFWIPYYCASGYNRWQEYGFDLACMQPNYSFGQATSALTYTAEQTRKLGMCVEMELEGGYNHEMAQRYMKYLQTGVEYGYMNAVKMYYQGGVPGAFYQAWQAEDSYLRAVYDLTYQYAKCKLSVEVPAYTATTAYTCNGRLLRGSQIAETTGACWYQLGTSPRHGNLQLNENGTFLYYPQEGFTGTDSFSVILDFGYAQSEELVITVTVAS